MQVAKLCEQRLELQAAMRWSEGLQAAHGLCELALGADPPASAGLIPGNGDVDETLVEVALLGRSGAPGELELLMRREVLARTNERDAGFKVSTWRRCREAMRALPARPS